MTNYANAEVIEVIRTELEMRGHTDDNIPIHTVTQYYTLDGELLTEDCPMEECNCDDI